MSGRMDSRCLPTVRAIDLSHQSISSPLFNHPQCFCSHVTTVASHSFSWLTRSDPCRSGTQMVLCCWSPSASGFNELCIQRCPSAHHCCHELLFVFMWPSCVQSEIVWPFFSDVSHRQVVFANGAACQQFFFFLIYCPILCK